MPAPRGAEEETEAADRPEDPAGYMEWALEKAGGGGFFQYKYLVLMGLPWVYWGMQTYACLFFFEGMDISVRCPSGATRGVCATLGEGIFPGNGTDPCSLPDGASFEFTEEAMKASALSTFDLVCSRGHLVPALTTMFFGGFAVGLCLGGSWADSRGRKEAYLAGLVALVAPGILQATSADYAQFALARGLFGFAFGFMVMTPFVWSSEFLGRATRGTIVWSSNCCFALGQILLSPVAWYFQESWRQLAWAVFIMGCLLFAYVWFLHESPKWLASKQRFAAAHEVLCRVASGNGRPAPPPPPDDKRIALDRQFDEDTPGEKASCLQLCDKRLLPRFLVACASWFTVSFGFYGLSLNAGNLPLDIYSANAINGVVQIPAYLAAATLMEAPWCGRRLTCVVGFLVAGACLLLCSVISAPAMLVVLCYAGNFFISISFGTVFLYAAELFPTNIRAQGLGITSVLARVGAMVSPFVAALGKTSPGLPLLIFGVPCLVCGCLMFLLPETRGTILPDTIDDVELLSKEETDDSDEDSDDEDSDSVGGTVVEMRTSLVSSRRS